MMKIQVIVIYAIENLNIHPDTFIGLLRNHIREGPT